MNLKTGTFLAGAALALTSMPALAQDLCGGIGGQGTWIGGDEASSDITTSGSALDQAALMVPPGGTSVTLFSVSGPTNVRVEALPQFGGDTVIDLYDAAGAVVLTDDDSGGNLASRGEAPLQPGTYCLSTRSFGGGPLVADLRVGRADEHEALTPGWGGFGGGAFAGVEACMPSTPATPLGSGAVDPMLAEGVTATNTIAGTPYYRFSLNQPAPVTIRAENPMADPYIYIYDGQGNLIAENDDYDGLNSRIDFTAPLAAGTYCIAMRSLSDPNQPVTVTLRGYDPAAAMAELYATGEASPPMDGSYPITDLGELAGRLVRDGQVSGSRNAVWYAFTVPSPGMLLIDAIGVNNSDPVITLFDELGRQIGYNDDSNGTLDSQLAMRIGSGTYLLGVRQYSDSYTGVIRVAIERFVPAQ